MWLKISSYRDFIIVAIAAFLLGFGVASLVWQGDGISLAEEDSASLEDNGSSATSTLTNNDNNVKAPPASGSTISGINEVRVSNQRAGNTVVVDQVVLANPGWIVVREEVSGKIGNILGALWLPRGTHKMIAVELLRPTVGAGKYHVFLSSDGGNNRTFDSKEDTYLTKNSAPIESVFETIASSTGW